MSENEYLRRYVEKNGNEQLTPMSLWDPSVHEREMELLHDRFWLVMEYAWAVPSDAALDALAARAPIVEVGAGGGYWAMLLRQRGVDVVAYDLNPGPRRSPTEPGYERERRVWSEVLPGDELVAGDHPERALFLCWPPYDTPMGERALASYLDAGGQTLVYVGEGEGGCNATDDFFALVEARLDEGETIAIPRFPGIHDYLTIYTRKWVSP